MSDIKINSLHEMFEARMNELIDLHIRLVDKKYNQIQQANMPSILIDEAFKAGYTAALNDLQGKVDGLVEALKQINREELNSQRPGGGYSTSAKISYKALAEFTASTVSKNGEDAK